MKQLTLEKPRVLKWWDVPEPTLQTAHEAIVRPFVAARCDGDSMFLRHDYRRVLRAGAFAHVIDNDFASARTDLFHGPFPYGHEGVAEIVQVGAEVHDFRVGDRVVVPWSISCGTCGCCSRGLTSKCEWQPRALPTAYGFSQASGTFGGMVSDRLRVPFADAMLVRAPAGVDPVALASASDNLVDGYRAVGPTLARQPGAPVLIVGGSARSIGLYAAGLAVALGASHVDYLDSDDERLAAAERVGARAWKCSPGRSKAMPMPLTGGYPITADASSSGDGLRHALLATAPGGECTGLGFYLRKNTGLPLWKLYMRDVTLRIGVAHARAHLPHVLELVASGAFDPNLLRPCVADWSDAPEALLEDTTKVILRRRPLHTSHTGDLEGHVLA